MRRLVVIPHIFPGMNDFIRANRTKTSGRWSKGNAMKQADQRLIMEYLPDVRFKKPVILKYTFYERNRRRDLDNISGYFHKVFQDALVRAGVLENDGWAQIKGYTDTFKIDPKLPRVEISIEEAP